MIDIHSHVLPGVDDGSQDMDMSLELLTMAADSGVEVLVATPHCNIPDEFDNFDSPELQWLFERLDTARLEAGIRLRLCRGAEIFATPELPDLLKEGRAWTLNGTRYFLTEFSFDEDPAFCNDILSECASMGFRPVIAHPERYFFLQDDPRIAFDWCISGYALQVNKGSLLGRFGPGPQETAGLLLDHGLVACVASDAHHPLQRTTHMGQIAELLVEEYGEGYAGLLLEDNPARILSGRDLLGYEPIPFD